jgi:hypothetical protein
MPGKEAGLVGAAGAALLGGPQQAAGLGGLKAAGLRGLKAGWTAEHASSTLTQRLPNVMVTYIPPRP